MLFSSIRAEILALLKVMTGKAPRRLSRGMRCLLILNTGISAIASLHSQRPLDRKRGSEMELREGLVAVGSAVSLYRSKFTDCLAGPVRNHRRTRIPSTGFISKQNLAWNARGRSKTDQEGAGKPSPSCAAAWPVPLLP
jgi:hypothetical protein